MATVNIVNNRRTPKASSGDSFSDTSAIIYRGPSLFDGVPIVVVATFGSKNGKTGSMLQTWILLENVAPSAAVTSGEDSSICGDCAHRGNEEENRIRSCYVEVWRAPRSIWEAFKRNRYRDMTSQEQVKSIGRGQNVRLGSYGDPMAVPINVWIDLLSDSNGKHTGYGHQWLNAPAEYAQLLMASVDTPALYEQAKARGYRTFRVKTPDQPKFSNEIVCPASKEAGHRTTCLKCGLCGGTTTKTEKDIVIDAHGPTGKIKAASRIARA